MKRDHRITGRSNNNTEHENINTKEEKVEAVLKEKIESKRENASVPQTKDKCARSNSGKKATNIHILRTGRRGRGSGGG